MSQPEFTNPNHNQPETEQATGSKTLNIKRDFSLAVWQGLKV